MRPATPYRAAAACVLLFVAAPFVRADSPPTLLQTWGTYGSGPGQFNGPGGVCVEGSDYVYVADQGNNRIQKFRSDGAFVKEWGHFGSGPGDLYHPTRIHLAPNGQLYVTEHQNHRVSRFTRDGVFLGSFPSDWSDYLAYPVGVASDSAGNIYVVGATTHRVHKYDSNGSPLFSWGGYGSGPGQLITPYGVEVGPDGFVYVSEYDGNRVQKFTTSGTFIGSWGSYGTGPGQFHAAEAVAFDAAGNVYVADTGNDRVQKFTPGGTYLGEFPVPYSNEAEHRPIPSDLVFDPDGNLYVVGAGSARLYKYGFNRAPDCTGASASLLRTWPPNGTLVPVTISGITDADGDPISVGVTAITQDEPLTDERRPRSAGDTWELEPNGDPQRRDDCPDGVIDAAGNAQVRLERLPRNRGGNGRVYRLTFEAGDGRESCVGEVSICVPLVRGGGCEDEIVSSLGPCPPSARPLAVFEHAAKEP